MHIGDLANGKAETIEGAILQYLSDKMLSIMKLCALGSDGASLITGRLNGVAVRLKSHSPSVIAVHCVNHRMASAAAHTSESILYLPSNIQINPSNTIHFFQNSPIRMASLHAIHNDPVIKCRKASDVPMTMP